MKLKIFDILYLTLTEKPKNPKIKLFTIEVFLTKPFGCSLQKFTLSLSYLKRKTD